MRTKFARLLCGGLCSAAIFFASGANADGTFFQTDLSGTTSGVTVSIGRGELTYGGGAVRYEGGYALGLNATYKLPFRTDLVTVRVGPSLGTTHNDGKPGPIDFGLKIASERYIPTKFGSLYFLADLNSIDTSWFLLSQFSFAQAGMAVELSHGESTTYTETSLAIAKRLTGSPVSLRVGYRFDSSAVFAGISINTF
ncbi:hypothetical protein [Loktanella atrilutea]|uniref:hypothetical protein n=1 Tax=Loktanella atrilutea TaxID=366533 RepID=UPI00093527B2|nr:hypothetical protein [Loktanella atrilutea]